MRGIGSLVPDRTPFAAFAIVFGVAFGLSLGLTPLARWLGLRLGLVDQPRDRHQHKGNIPRTGGIAIYLAFVAAVLVAQLLPVERFDPKEIIRLFGLLLGGTLIFLVGLYDDWRELSPLALYISQVLAGAIAIAFLILIEYVNNPLTGQQTPDFAYPVTITITLFWLGLMMNTVNFLDGLDGLASGVAAIAGALLFINAAFRLDPPQYSVALLPVALVGATLGFLPFNFAPARIFMGSGAYFLGFVLGALSIIGGAKMATILLVMGLPVLDLTWQTLRRVREGQNPMHGDRGHLHFRLLDSGLPQQVIVLGYYAFCAGFGALSLFISSRLYKLIALIAMGVLAAVGFGLVASRSAQSKKPEEPPADG
jgi:UDP-GlcNAc:undecaprenyl-phosphate GlcNAc-1-phosphate transferase